MKYLKHELSQEIEVLSLAEVYEIHIYMIYILTAKSKSSQMSSTLTEDISHGLHCLWIYSCPS